MYPSSFYVLISNPWSFCSPFSANEIHQRRTFPPQKMTKWMRTTRNITQEKKTRTLFQLKGSERVGMYWATKNLVAFFAENMRLSHYLLSSCANVYVSSNKPLQLFTLCLISTFIRRSVGFDKNFTKTSKFWLVWWTVSVVAEDHKNLPSLEHALRPERRVSSRRLRNLLRNRGLLRQLQQTLVQLRSGQTIRLKLQAPKIIHNHNHHYHSTASKIASSPYIIITEKTADFKAQSPHPTSQGTNKHPATYDISIYRQTPSTSVIFFE